MPAAELFSRMVKQLAEQKGVTQQVYKTLEVYKETGSIAKTITILGCQKRERADFFLDQMTASPDLLFLTATLDKPCQCQPSEKYPANRRNHFSPIVGKVL